MMVLKPQDLVVLLKLVAESEQSRGVRQVELAVSLKISQSEVHKALLRSEQARLLTPSVKSGGVAGRQVRRGALLEYAIHGLKYVWPVRLKEQTRGVPTAWGLESVRKGLVTTDNDCPVWPWHLGTALGPSVEPLYQSVPEAVAQEPRLHQLLALVDCVRLGRVRDRDHAIAQLKVLVRS